MLALSLWGRLLAGIYTATPLPHPRRPEDLRYACLTILSMSPDCPSRPTLYHTLLDLYLSGGGGSSSSGEQQKQQRVQQAGQQQLGQRQQQPAAGANAGQRDALDLLK